MHIDRDEILVDIGSKSEGVVPSKEMSSLLPEEQEEIHVGDEVLVFVVQSEDKEGRAVLSLDKARQEKSWRRLQQQFETGEVLQAKVINYNKGGVLVNLDGVRGFVPASQVTGISRGPDAQKQSDMARMVGGSLTLKIIEINRNRNRLILSERQAVQEVREARKDEILETAQGRRCSRRHRDVDHRLRRVCRYRRRRRPGAPERAFLEPRQASQPKILQGRRQGTRSMC